jgi:hypothetical protein
MAVMPDHCRGGDDAAVTSDQDRRILPAARERDVGGGIVPGSRQAATLPQRDDIGDISILDCRNR